MIGKLTRTIVRTFAFALALCATSAWAAADMINVNLYENTTYSAVSELSPTSNMGYLSYAVQNTYWSDIAANNGSGTAKLYDSSIPGQLENTVSVAVTGASGAYHPEAGFDYTLLSGYIDDNATMTPTITLSSVPFDYYRVIVYFATDSYTRKYGHITLNDKLNIYGVYSSDLDEGYTDIGTNGNEGWGGCAPYQTVAGSKVVYMKEGRNVLISPVVTKTTDSSVKIESHALKTSDWVYRSCVAAVQVVKADTPATCTYTAPGTDTYNLFGAGNWDVEPASGSEAVTIAISGNTTLTVNDSRVFRSLTITGSGELTFAGTGTIITPSLTIGSGITLVKTAGNISSSATVSVPSGCTFEIASACTWSGVISGQGGVKVSANSVVFSSSNSFSGGLIVGEGGLVSTTQSTGFGTANSTITVQSGGSANIANTASAGYYYNIAGTGLNDIGALYSSGAMGNNAAQTRGITLSADATITVGANWGLICSSFDPTALELGQYTLTKNGNGRFWMCNTTVSGAGKLLINSGYVVTVNSNKKVQGANAEIQVGSGGALFIGGDTNEPPSGYSNLTIKKLTCDSGGTVSVASGRQLLIKNGGDMTVNGTATITGTLKLAEDETASSTGTLTVGGTVTVTGTVDIPHRANIVRSGTGKVDIKSGGKVHYNYVFKNVNSKDYGWKSDYEGDVFTGAGTLEIRTNRTSIHDATSSFSGIVKLYTASASNTGYINVLDGLTFTQRPEFITEGYYNLGNTATLAVRDLSGSGVFLSNYSPYNLKYIDTKQTKPTTFSGTFLNDGADSNTRDVGLTVRGSEDGVYALTLSGASTSRTALTIQDNGKVIFPSTGGSWSSGTVVVANGGYIEAQNTSALGTVDIQSGSVIVIPTVSDAPVALTCSTVTLPTSGTVTIDLSGVSVGEGDTITVISASTLNNADASIFKQTSGNWLFLVDDNAIKAKKLGVINWSAGSWSDAPNFAAYRDATISASGTQSVTIPATTAFDTLTLSGSGTICFSATGSETVSIKSLEIGADVTLTANSVLDLTGCEITGDGTLDIPAGTTLAMDGVTCSTKVTIEGTLETSGATTLSAANTSAAGSLIHVVGGKTVLSTAPKGIKGNITIDSTAELQSDSSHDGVRYQHIDYAGSSCIDIAGKLNMDNCAWFLGVNNVIKLRDGANVTGYGRDGNNYGNWTWVGQGNIEAYGDSTLNITINTASGTSPVLTISQDATLKITKAFTAQDCPYYAGGSITKAGAGTLQFTQETLTKPIAINEGKVQLRRAFTSGLAISIASGAELELGVGHGDTDINATSISFAGVTGTGTIRFSSSHTGYYTLPSSAANMFATTLHVANDNTVDGLVIPWSGGVTTNRLLTAAGKYRTDWSGSNDVADRYFLALQDCDATWSGVFHQNDRLHGMKVAGVESAEHKTLTLSGTQSHTNTLEVEPSGSVNLTGLWIGDTTVNGEFGGTGSIDGALTLNAGSTFKVWATGGLSVTGSVTFPEDGISVDVSDLTIGREDSTVLLTATSGSNFPTVENFTLTGSSTHVLSRTGQKELSLLPIIATYSRNDGSGIVTPYADSVDIAISALVMQKATYPNAYVTVFIGAPSYYTAELLASNGIALDAETGNYVVAEAKIDTVLYPTIEAAIDAAEESDVVELARNVARAKVAVNSEIKFSEGSYTFSGAFTGSGTIVLGAALKAPSADRWAAGWTGTVELKDITTEITNFDFAHYGNANSTVRANNVLVRMPETSGEYGNVGTIEVATGGLKFGGDPIENANFTFAAAITGTGTIGVGTRCETGNKRMSQYIFTGSMSGFAGGVDYNNTGYYKATIVFKAGNDEIPQRDTDEWGQILVSENTTLNLSKEMYGPAGIVLAGTINVLEGGSIRVDSPSGKQIKGSGTINYTIFPSSAPKFNNAWTGTVHLPGKNNLAGEDFGNFGKSESKIVIDGDMAGWIAQNTSVTAEFVLDGHSLTVNDFSERSYSFSKISGSGALSFNHKEGGHQPATLSIGEVMATYSGTINNNTTTTLTINKLVLPAIPACDAKVLAVGGTGEISLDVGNVKVGETSLPAKYKLERRHKGEEGDGFYVYYNGTIFSVY